MKLQIANLRLNTFIGVSDEEQKIQREIVVSVELEYNAGAACRSDSIAEAVDYRSVRDRVAELVQSGRLRLIETLAQRIVHSLSEDTRITGLAVRVEKPGALRLADFVSASVTWERGA